MNISHNTLYRTIDKCLCCGSSDLDHALKYRESPLTDIYRDSASEALSLPCFPLDVYICRECSHLQLKHQVHPELSYSEYIYQSSTTKGLSKGFEEYAEYLRSRHPPAGELALLDVGSNDGSFLLSCQRLGIRAYGVEPASKLAEYCKNRRLPTACCYFDSQILEVFAANDFPRSFNLITFNNVLANMPSPLDALILAKNLLASQESLICIQTGYHPKQFSKGLFDWVYHEHFSYFSLKSISRLAERAGLYIADYSFSEIRGGSVRVLLSTKQQQRSLDYEYFTESEHFYGLSTFLKESSKFLIQRLNELLSEGYTLHGFGASHSTGILVHNFQIADYLTCIYDDNPRKHGLFMPGTALRVGDPVGLLDESPDKSACVVLAWQYYDGICRRLRTLGYQGKILKPVLI